MRRARCSLVAAYAFGAFPLVSTIVQWSAAIRGSREIGRPLGYRDFDNTELSAGATVHVDLGASVLVLSVLLVPVGSVVVGVWLYLNRRDFWPIALWLCGVSVWWLSAFASPVFFGLAERVLD